MYHIKKMDPNLYEATKESNIDVLMQYKDQLGVQLTANNSTVLHVAAQFHDNIECVRVILDLQPSLLCQVNSKGETALHIAARNGRSNTVRELIEHTKSFKGGLKIFPSFISSYLVWRLSYLVWRLSSPGVQISKKMMIWIPNKHNDTALHEAVRNNHLDVVEMLVREDAVSPHVVNNFGETSLYIAAKKGYHEIVSTILEACKSSTHGGPDGRTALHAAVMAGCSDAVSPHVVNNSGETPLYIVPKKQQDSHSHANIVSKILEDCKSPAHSGPDGSTALHAAVIAGCPECTKKILEKKPKLMHKANLDGWTPLHYAASRNNVPCAIQLLNADTSTAYDKDKVKQTPLHIAAREGHTDIMKELLLRCPDCWEIVNGKGQNILHIAQEHENEGVINFIRCLSVENCNLENQMDNDGNTPFNLSTTSNKDLTSIIKGNKPEEDEIKEEPENTDAGHQLDGIPETEMKESEAENTKMREDFKTILNTDLVVAALVATVTFTAGLTLPGGFHSNEGPDPGRAVLVRVAAFKAFVITNALAMGFSFAAITVYLISPLSKKRKELEKQIATGVSLIQYAMMAMLIAFMTGSYAVLANSLDLAVGVIIIGSSFYAAASVFHEKCLKDAYATLGKYYR